jgi:hypothetical protein
MIKDPSGLLEDEGKASRSSGENNGCFRKTEILKTALKGRKSCIIFMHGGSTAASSKLAERRCCSAELFLIAAFLHSAAQLGKLRVLNLAQKTVQKNYFLLK